MMMLSLSIEHVNIVFFSLRLAFRKIDAVSQCERLNKLSCKSVQPSM
jgi:hypothetical protein